MASRIGHGIHGTSQKLERLAQLAKRSGMFDDPAREIAELSAVIKQDITALNTAIAELQNHAARARAVPNKPRTTPSPSWTPSNPGSWAPPNRSKRCSPYARRMSRARTRGGRCSATTRARAGEARGRTRLLEARRVPGALFPRLAAQDGMSGGLGGGGNLQGGRAGGGLLPTHTAGGGGAGLATGGSSRGRCSSPIRIST